MTAPYYSDFGVTPHGVFIPANYQLDRRQAATLSCDHCAMRVKLSWGDRAAMLNRRDDLLADHPEVTTTAELAPLMGDLEPVYWDWALGRVEAGEVPKSGVSS